MHCRHQSELIAHDELCASWERYLFHDPVVNKEDLGRLVALVLPCFVSQRRTRSKALCLGVALHCALFFERHYYCFLAKRALDGFSM